jgi:hypothetical protein
VLSAATVLVALTMALGLERGAREFKYYAPGVGLVQDGGLKLVPSR